MRIESCTSGPLAFPLSIEAQPGYARKVFGYLGVLLAAFWAAAASWLPRRFQRTAWAGLGAALVLFLGLRRQVGCDWNLYLLLYERVNSRPLAEAFALSDPGYVALNRLAAWLGLGVAGVNLAAAAIFVSGLLIFARAQPRPALGLLLATPVLLMIVGLAPTRQAIAVGLELWALHLFLSGRRGWAAALLLLAPLFHWSGLILTPFIPLMFKRTGLPNWAIAGAGGAAGAALLLAVWTMPSASELIATYPPAGGAWFRQIPTLIAFAGAVLLWWRGGLGEREKLVVTALSALGLFALSTGFVATAVMDRIGYYLVPLQIIVLTRIPGLLPPGGTRAAAVAAVALPGLVMFTAWLSLTTQTACYLPYRSYLEDPGWILKREVPEPWWLQPGSDTHYPNADRRH